jgi:hypothetical protein
VRSQEVRAHGRAEGYTSGQLRPAPAHQGRRGDADGAQAAHTALRDGDHRTLSAAGVVGGRSADRDVFGRGERAARGRHHAGVVGYAGLGLDGERAEPEDLRQDQRVAGAATGGRFPVCLPRWPVAEAELHPTDEDLSVGTPAGAARGRTSRCWWPLAWRRAATGRFWR